MTELIISYLLQNEYAIRWKLLSYLKSRGYPITERGLRYAIVRLITKEGHLITSTKHGWHLVKNHKDLEAHKAYLLSYIKRLQKRVKSMEKNFKTATAKLYA